MQTTCQELCILSSFCLFVAGCGDNRQLLAPTEPSPVIGAPTGEIPEDVPPEFREAVDLYVLAIVSISETNGSTWGLASAYSNRLLLKATVDLHGTSEGHGEINLARSYLLPLRHSLHGSARAAVQAVCGGVANGSAFGKAYNEALVGRGSTVIFSNQEGTDSKTAAQPPCVDGPPEGGTDQPVGGGGGGSSGDDGDCVLWGKWIDGVLVYTWFVGKDC